MPWSFASGGVDCAQTHDGCNGIGSHSRVRAHWVSVDRAKDIPECRTFSFRSFEINKCRSTTSADKEVEQNNKNIIATENRRAGQIRKKKATRCTSRHIEVEHMDVRRAYIA